MPPAAGASVSASIQPCGFHGELSSQPVSGREKIQLVRPPNSRLYTVVLVRLCLETNLAQTVASRARATLAASLAASLAAARGASRVASCGASLSASAVTVGDLAGDRDRLAAGGRDRLAAGDCAGDRDRRLAGRRRTAGDGGGDNMLFTAV